MKIGLLTVPFNNNFGGFLQAYALKSVLTKLGHEVIIINRRRNRGNRIKSTIRNLLTSIGFLKDIDKILNINTDKFISRYLTPGTPYYFSSRELRKCKEYGLDFYIVGSDQVWRYKYAQDSIDDFFFSFLRKDETPRISYAASFGIENLDYPEDKKNICSQLLKKFSGISVREYSGIKQLKDLGVKQEEVSVVLDPTMLLDKNHYFSNLIQNINSTSSNKYIFSYVLDSTPDKEYFINKIAELKNLQIIQLKAQTDTMGQIAPIAPVEEWLQRIYYSDFVVTDSFHGTVFSILFNKPFIVIGNSSRGLTRFTSLLSMFGLEDRMIISNDDYRESLLEDSIDWSNVNSKIDKMRIDSLNFLTSNLRLVSI